MEENKKEKENKQNGWQAEGIVLCGRKLEQEEVMLSLMHGLHAAKLKTLQSIGIKVEDGKGEEATVTCNDIVRLVTGEVMQALAYTGGIDEELRSRIHDDMPELKANMEKLGIYVGWGGPEKMQPGTDTPTADEA